MDKVEKRKLRQAELERLTVGELKDVRPYTKDSVGPTKTESTPVKTISKAEMIETILSHEGLGQRR